MSRLSVILVTGAYVTSVCYFGDWRLCHVCLLFWSLTPISRLSVISVTGAYVK